MAFVKRNIAWFKDYESSNETAKVAKTYGYDLRLYQNSVSKLWYALVNNIALVSEDGSNGFKTREAALEAVEGQLLTRAQRDYQRALDVMAMHNMKGE